MVVYVGNLLACLLILTYTLLLNANFACAHESWSSLDSTVRLCRINLVLYSNNSEDPLHIVLPGMCADFNSSTYEVAFELYCMKELGFVGGV